MGGLEIVNKVRNYARVLRDDSVTYGDYVEQLKMVQEGFRSVEEALLLE